MNPTFHFICSCEQSHQTHCARNSTKVQPTPQSPKTSRAMTAWRAASCLPEAAAQAVLRERPANSERGERYRRVSQLFLSYYPSFNAGQGAGRKSRIPCLAHDTRHVYRLFNQKKKNRASGSARCKPSTSEPIHS